MLAVVLALVVGAAALALAQSDPDPVGDEAETAAGSQACSKVPESARKKGRVTCRSATTTLTIASADTPVVLSDTDVRVYRNEVEGGTMLVRVRVRNKTRERQLVNPGGRQFYLNVGRRLYSEPLAERKELPPGEAASLNVRFALDARALQELRRRDEVALGVVPFNELDDKQPSRLGVIRLSTGAAPQQQSAQQPTGAVPSCSDVPAAQLRGGRVTCKSATATLTIAPMSTPVLFEDMAFRAYGARLEGNVVTVRARVRNPSDHFEIIRPGSRQYYLNTRPDRVYATHPRHVIEPHTAEVVDLRFALPPAAVQQLRNRGGLVGLGIVPYAELDDAQPSRLGSVRLKVGL